MEGNTNDADSSPAVTEPEAVGKTNPETATAAAEEELGGNGKEDDVGKDVEQGKDDPASGATVEGAAAAEGKTAPSQDGNNEGAGKETPAADDDDEEDEDASTASPAKNTRSASSTSAPSPKKTKATKPAASRKSTRGHKSPQQLGLAPLPPAPKPAIPASARRALRNLLFTLTDQQFEYEILVERQRRIALAVEATASSAKTAASGNKRKRGDADAPSATTPRKKKSSAKDGQYFIPGMPGVYPPQPIAAADVAKSKKSKSNKRLALSLSAVYDASNKSFTPKQLLNEQKWEERYQQLQEFKTKYGHINVTNSHDPQLRKWLSRQRQEWKKVYDDEQKHIHGIDTGNDDDGKKRSPKPSSTMTRDKIMKLALIGVGSLQNGPSRSMGNVNRGLKEWDVKFEELVAFKNEHGHCNVSRSAHKHSHGALANWVGTQRLKFQNRQLQLQKGNTGIFDDDDDVSSSDEDENLDAGLDEATKKRNKAKRRKSKVLAKRRKERLILTDEQMTKLASIGFVFKIHSDWDERFQQIVEYKAKYGHTRVPVAFEGYNKLGRWVNTIKTLYHSSNPKKRNQLSDERIAKLNTIQFDWELRSGPFPNRIHGMSKQSNNNNNRNNSTTNASANANTNMTHNNPMTNMPHHHHNANPTNVNAHPANTLPHPLQLQQQQHLQHGQPPAPHHHHHHLPPNPNNYYYDY